jgi:DNA transformation protein and related proteins
MAKRMFGGYGISVDGLTVAILADLGQGEILWLKASESTRPIFEAQSCARFTYTAKGVPRSVNYYSAPEEAMDSAQAMQPWARLALEAALGAKKTPRKAASKRKA